MATIKVKISNGFFVEATPIYLEELTPTKVVGNGWNCEIKEDGTVQCDSVREYSDGEYSIRYVIRPNGFAKLTLKTPYENKTLKKGYVLPKGEKLKNGLIGLAGGNIKERYAYFRNDAFQMFLESHGITAVQHEDPNQLYVLRNSFHGAGSCSSEILTDGVLERIQYDSGESSEWAKEGSSAFAVQEHFQVKRATWVLFKQTQNEYNSRNHSVILYSLERDLTKLVGLP